MKFKWWSQNAYIHRHHNDNICMFDYLAFTAECASMFVVEMNVDIIFEYKFVYHTEVSLCPFMLSL